MKILVTGGVGFIGFHLSSKLIQSHEVVVVDNFNSYYDVKLKNLNKQELEDLGVKVINANILEYEKMNSILKDIDIVYHLAAQPGVRYSVDYPLKVFKINVEGTFSGESHAKRSSSDRRPLRGPGGFCFGGPHAALPGLPHPLLSPRTGPRNLVARWVRGCSHGVLFLSTLVLNLRGLVPRGRRGRTT